MKTLLHLSPAGRQYWRRTRQGWQPLADEPDTRDPIWIITDLAEESFAEIETPRLYGRDRTDLVDRQLATRFPDTPYRSRLKVDHGGKLIERLVPTRFTLFGITAAEKLNAEFDARNITIAALCPTSLLLTRMAQHKQLPPDLFVVLPSAAGLRIVFVKNRIPILTRLAPIPDQVAAQAEEIIRTHRYLENVRTLQRGSQPPSVMILGNAGAFAAPLAAARLELVAPPPPWNNATYSDWRLPLFDLALREQPFGQLAPVARRTVYLARRLQQGALAAAAAAVAAGVLAAGTNAVDIFGILRDKEQNQATIHRLNTQLADLDQRTATFGVTPELVRRAVTLNNNEIVSAPSLDLQLRQVAGALAGESGARIGNLEWRLLAPGAVPCAKLGGAASAASAETPSAADAAPAESPEHPERKVELAFNLLLPNSTPGIRAEALRRISARLGKMAGTRLWVDPTTDLSKGTLRGGASVGEDDKGLVWCLTLPGTLQGADKARPEEAKLP